MFRTAALMREWWQLPFSSGAPHEIEYSDSKLSRSFDAGWVDPQ
jgi:hypothetical protein